MGILYYVVEINFFYWKILLLASVFASLFIIYIFGTDLPTCSYYLQFPSADLFFLKKSSGHPLEFSVAGVCRLKSGGLKQKGNLGAHLAVKPSCQRLKWLICHWTPGFFQSLALPAHVCFILSYRWWQEGSQQLRADLPPSSCGVAPRWL